MYSALFIVQLCTHGLSNSSPVIATQVRSRGYGWLQNGDRWTEVSSPQENGLQCSHAVCHSQCSSILHVLSEWITNISFQGCLQPSHDTCSGSGHRGGHPGIVLKITEFKATAMRYGLCSIYRLVTDLKKQQHTVS